MTQIVRSADKWCAYECAKCSAPGTSGLVFNIRLDSSEAPLNAASRPRCLAACPLLGFWSADGTCGGHTCDGRWPR